MKTTLPKSTVLAVLEAFASGAAPHVAAAIRFEARRIAEFPGSEVSIEDGELARFAYDADAAALEKRLTALVADPQLAEPERSAAKEWLQAIRLGGGKGGYGKIVMASPAKTRK